MTIRRTIGGQGGGGAAAAMGTDAESLATSMLGSSRSISSEGEGAVYPLALMQALGADGDAVSQSGIVAGGQAMGDEGESLSKIILFRPNTLGDEGDALVLGGTIAVDTYAGTAERVDIAPTGGSATWASPNNAKARDGVESTISVSGSIVIANALSDQLKLSTFSPAGTPVGWTTAAALLTVRHRWPFDFAVLDIPLTGTSLTFTMSAVFSGGVTDVLKTVVCNAGGRAAQQAALVTEQYDLTLRVITQGRTLNEVRFDAEAFLPITLSSGTTIGWNVDSAALTMSLTKASIT